MTNAQKRNATAAGGIRSMKSSFDENSFFCPTCAGVVRDDWFSARMEETDEDDNEPMERRR